MFTIGTVDTVDTVDTLVRHGLSGLGFSERSYQLRNCRCLRRWELLIDRPLFMVLGLIVFIWCPLELPSARQNLDFLSARCTRLCPVIIDFGKCAGLRCPYGPAQGRVNGCNLVFVEE